MKSRVLRRTRGVSSSSARDREVEVTVYRVTGRQLFFNVSRSVCEECDLTVAAVARAIKELDGVGVNFRVKAWLNNLPVALLHGAYHPPVLLVNGRVVSQGVVPAVEEIKRAILRRRNQEPLPMQTDTASANSRSEGLPTGT